MSNIYAKKIRDKRCYTINPLSYIDIYDNKFNYSRGLAGIDAPVSFNIKCYMCKYRNYSNCTSECGINKFVSRYIK